MPHYNRDMFTSGKIVEGPGPFDSTNAPWPIENASGYDESAYIGDDDQHDLDTATFWTLHLCTTNDTLEAAKALLTHVLGTGCEALTGNYCGGDTFAEWCEVYDATKEFHFGKGRALHLTFTAHDRIEAILLVMNIRKMLMRQYGDFYFPGEDNYCISTAADWAEQISVLEVRG